MKESKENIAFQFKKIKVSTSTPSEFVTRLSFLILCIHDVTEAHRCKNHVIYHHFVERILTDFVDMEEFLFSYEFPNFVVHSYQFEPLRKNENAQRMLIRLT